MNKAELETKLKELWLKRFDSLCTLNYGLGKETLYFSGYLAKDETEFPNKIIQNSMLRFTVFLHDCLDNEGNLLENLQLDVSSNSLVIKPKDQYLYCSHEKIAIRSGKVKLSKLLDKFDSYFQKVYDTIIANKNNLLESDKYLLKNLK